MSRKGGAPLLQDLGAGLVDITIMPWATAYQGLATQGRLKILGWLGPRRDSLMPELPAAGEGSLLKDFDYTTWSGLLVRKETPDAVVACLHQALHAALAQPKVQKAILATGSRPAAPQSLESSAQRLEAEAVRFQTLARRIHLEPQ